MAQRMPGTLVPHAANGGRLLGPAPSSSLCPLETTMAKPLPLPVWDRERGELLEEWMDDHQPHYESEPQRSVTQWVKAQPFYDRLYALYENSRWSTREIEPLIRKHRIDMAEFEQVGYRSFAEFFDRRFRPGVRKFPSAA